MTTGQIIKILRESKGMTQEELADAMGYSHKSSINKIEMGKSDIPQSKLIAFAKILGVSPAELVGAEPNAVGVQWVPRTENFNENQKLPKKETLLNEIREIFGAKTAEAVNLFAQLNENGKRKAIENLQDLTAIEKYTTAEKVYNIKIAARNGEFKETTITESELQRIKNLPDAEEF